VKLTISKSSLFDYAATALKEDDPKEAIQGFEKVLTLETEKGEWCVALSFLHLGSPGLT
jgi:hypothetical protein